MRTRTPYDNFEALDNDIRNLIGEELYKECEERRNKPSKFGYQWTHFIKKTDGKVTYHFLRPAFEIVYDYVFDNRDSDLWNAYKSNNGDGYKMIFLVNF